VNTPELATLERRFLQLISQPEPIAEAARLLEARDLGASTLSSWLSADSEELAAMRLGIYAHMYFARLTESLREDFPKVAQLLGADFEVLAARYLVEHPSDHPSLRYHGRYFPGFLRHCASGEHRTNVVVREELADLSALEWARIDAFDAAEAPILKEATLIATLPEAWGALSLRWVPACQLLSTRSGVAAFWAALDREEVLIESELFPPRLEATSEWVFIWRRGFRVYHRVLDARESAALCLLSTGLSLAELCEACESAVSPSGEPLPDSTPEWLLGRLAQWLVDEVLLGHEHV
jgi:hypothetical protein